MTCPSPSPISALTSAILSTTAPARTSDVRTRGRIAPSHALIPAAARSVRARSPPCRASRSQPARSRQAPPRGGRSPHAEAQGRPPSTVRPQVGWAVRALPQLRPTRRRPARADPGGGGRPSAPARDPLRVSARTRAAQTAKASLASSSVPARRSLSYRPPAGAFRCDV